MYEPHPVFDTPSDDTRIWRYLDLAKFIWMLKESSLYFPRADLLGDDHEGSLPRLNFEARRALTSEPRWEWARGIDPDRPTFVTNVAHLFVSCWNISDYENAALWSIYGKAVAIRTTVGRLRDSITTAERFYIGGVRYIDYERDSFPGDNGYYPIVHKRRYFEAEHELRAVLPGQTHADLTDDAVWTGDPRAGVPVSVDLDGLVEKVWVAPGQTLLREVVEALVERFELDRPVGQSRLDSPPRY